MTIHFVDQPNTFGGCYYAVRDQHGFTVAKFYDRERAERFVKFGR